MLYPYFKTQLPKSLFLSDCQPADLVVTCDPHKSIYLMVSVDFNNKVSAGSIQLKDCVLEVLSKSSVWIPQLKLYMHNISGLRVVHCKDL